MKQIQLALLLCLQTSVGFAQAFSKSPLITGLAYPVAFTQSSDGRIFLTQKGGFTFPAVDAQVSVYDANGNFLSEFCDLSDSIDCEFERGMLGITLDPGFDWNHFVYIFYTYDSDPQNGGDARIRIQRFTELSNVGIAPAIICDIDVPDNMTGAHQGGNIHFRPSDTTHIYVSMGDQDNGGNWSAQTGNPFGKILRISKFPGDPPPSDNPFYDDGNPATGNCDWIWAYGLRNSFDFCFGPNDSLYATENGASAYDELNLITRGGFYGWPACEGNFNASTTTPCSAPGAIAPLTTFPFPVPSLTGILFYTDTVFSAQQNHLVVGDYNHADLTDITLINPPAYNQVSTSVFWIDESQQYGITCLQQGPQGCIYVMEGGYTTNGGIYRICPDANSVADNDLNNSLLVSGANPFTTFTTLTYTLENATRVHLALYDAAGREVALLMNQEQVPGTHSVGVDAKKYGLSAGIYICIMQTDQFSQTTQLIIE